MSPTPTPTQVGLFAGTVWSLSAYGIVACLIGRAHIFLFSALANRYTSARTITAPFAALGVPSVGAASSFEVRDLWAAKALGRFMGSVSARVEAHDMAVFRLSS